MYNRKEITRNRDHKYIGTIKENDSRLRSQNTPQFKYHQYERQTKSPCHHNRQLERERQIHLSKNCKSEQSSSATMMELLLDENSNLKQQNYFLQQELNRMLQKQKQLTQTITQYESILSTLSHKTKSFGTNKTNIKLQDEPDHRADRIKTSYNEMFGQRKVNGLRTTAPLSQFNQEYENEGVKHIFNKQGYQTFKRNNTEKSNFMNLNLFSEIGKTSQLYNIPYKASQFEQLLQQCQNESDPKFKKYLRKKLVNLAYQKAAVTGYLS